MPETRPPWRIVLSPAARTDICDALIWREDRFGASAAARYRNLLKQAIRDIVADPERPDLARGVRTNHLFFSRKRARNELGVVERPRHFLAYRCREGGIDVVRVLHDARDLARSLPAGYLRSLDGPARK